MYLQKIAPYLLLATLLTPSLHASTIAIKPRRQRTKSFSFNTSHQSLATTATQGTRSRKSTTSLTKATSSKKKPTRSLSLSSSTTSLLTTANFAQVASSDNTSPSKPTSIKPKKAPRTQGPSLLIKQKWARKIQHRTFLWEEVNDLQLAQWINGRHKKHLQKDIKGLSIFHWTCYKGHKTWAQNLIKTRKIQPDILLDYKENSALYWACKGGQLAIVKWLTGTQNLSPTYKNAILPAMDNHHIELIKWLIGTHKLHLDLGCPASTIDFACKHNYTKFLDWLHQTYQSLDIADSNYLLEITLIKAAFHGKKNIIKALTKKYNTDGKHLFKTTNLLHYAAQGGQLDTLAWLIKTYGYNPYKIDYVKRNILDHASMGQHFEIVIEPLIQTYYPHLYTNPEPYVAVLHHACYLGNLALVKKLVKNYNLKPNQQHNNKNALDYACHGGHIPIVKWLINSCGLQPTKPMLLTTTLYRHFKLAKWLITNCDFELNQRGDFMYRWQICDDLSFAQWLKSAYNIQFGSSDLILAIEKGYLAVAKWILSTANISLSVNTLKPAYHHYTIPNFETLQWLVKTIALTGKKDKLELLSIISMHTTLRGFLWALDYLTNKKTKQKFLASKRIMKMIELTFYHHNYATMAWLIYHARIDLRDFRCKVCTRTALHFACETNNLRLAKYLVYTKKHNPFTTDKRGKTALHIAVISKRYKVVMWLRSLIKRKILAKNNQDETAYQIAQRFFSVPQICQYLQQEIYGQKEKAQQIKKTTHLSLSKL